MKKSIIILITLVGIVGSGLVFAKHHDPEKFVTKITEKLTLNDSQQTQFRAFLDEKKALKEQRKAYRDEKKTNSEKGKKSNPFEKLLEQDTISANDISAALSNKHSEKLKHKEKMFAAFATFYNNLSAEQRVKAKPMVKKLLSPKKSRKKKGDKKTDNHGKKHS